MITAEQKKYKNANNTTSLILPFNFAKISTVSSVIEAYNYLFAKGRRKSDFITTALKDYEQYDVRNRDFDRFMFRVRIAKKAKDLYQIRNKEKAKKLLSTPLDSDAFKEISDKVPETREPKKMLCGFDCNDPDAVIIHDKLCNLSVNERVLLVVNAVNTYVGAGKDEQLEEINVYRFVRDFIVEYNHYPEEQKEILNNFMSMINYLAE